MRRIQIVVMWAALIIAAQVASATIYTAAADFSTTTNPDPLNGGVWAYGWSSTLGGTFTTATDVLQDLGGVPGVVQWRGDQPPGADGNPSVFKNTNPSTANIGSITMPGSSLAFHPGSAGQNAVVQFTAPAAGQYSVSASFQGYDHVGPTDTSVYVLVGNTAIWVGTVSGFMQTPVTFNSTVSLTVGETVDFAVGFDPSQVSGRTTGLWYYDSTGLSATISSVPEPTTMVAGALLLLPFGASTLRILRKSRAA